MKSNRISKYSKKPKYVYSKVEIKLTKKLAQYIQIEKKQKNI